MPANYYWPIYKNLEAEVLDLAQHINFSDDQVEVYSIHIADLLIRCAVEIEAISRELYFQNGGKKLYDDDGKERPPYFDTECIAHLNSIWNICSKKIGIASENFFFEKVDNSILMPLKNANKRSKSKWNKAYQAVKHDRNNSIKDGNIKNLMNAMGSLYILNIYYADRNIKLGITHDPISKFDRRLGSEIFYVGIADATEIAFGIKNEEELISDGLQQAIHTAIYAIKYTDSSFKSVIDGLNKEINNIKGFRDNSDDYHLCAQNNGMEIEAVLVKDENIYNLKTKKE